MEFGHQNDEIHVSSEQDINNLEIGIQFLTAIVAALAGGTCCWCKISGVFILKQDKRNCKDDEYNQKTAFKEGGTFTTW